LSEKTNSARQLPKSIDTLIGAGVRMEADVACSGVLRVQGEILGNVSCDQHPDGTLIVDSAGSVTGAVSATHVSVRGHIVGPVRSQQSIEIHEGGSLVGDVAFREIAIHAGGVVDGKLTPLPGPESGTSTADPTLHGSEAAAGSGSDLMARMGGKRKIVVAVLVLAVAGVGAAWVNRNPELLAHYGAAGPHLDSAVDAAAEAPPVPAPLGAAQSAPKPSEPEPPPLAASQTVAAPPEPAEPPPAAVTENQEKVIAVRGINPSRPAGVFLLISNEQSVLYRKKRGDAGDGARIVVPAGEKSSVAVDSDELIRVAQGRDVVILFQGAKVPKPVIESGAWISFVPR
jgi:cytoskeletal protein CcmA (bactofilin family)